MVPALGIELSSNAYKAIASPFMLYGLIMAESKGIEPSNSYERRRFSRPFVPMDARLRISKLSKNMEEPRDAASHSVLWEHTA